MCCADPINCRTFHHQDLRAALIHVPIIKVVNKKTSKSTHGLRWTCVVGRQSTVNGAGVSCRAECKTLVTGTDPAVLRVPRANLPLKHSLEDMVGDTRLHCVVETALLRTCASDGPLVCKGSHFKGETRRTLRRQKMNFFGNTNRQKGISRKGCG